MYEILIEGSKYFSIILLYKKRTKTKLVGIKTVARFLSPAQENRFLVS